MSVRRGRARNQTRGTGHADMFSTLLSSTDLQPYCIRASMGLGATCPNGLTRVTHSLVDASRKRQAPSTWTKWHVGNFFCSGNGLTLLPA